MPSGALVSLSKEQEKWIQNLPDNLIWFHTSTPTEYAVILVDWWLQDMPEETVFWRPPTDKEYKAAVKRLKNLVTG